MTMDLVKGRIAFHCDTCPDSLETDAQSINEAMVQLREAGWAFYKEDGQEQFKHRCRDCFNSGRLMT